MQGPNYPWTLGRIFFKKYQFVFDSLNKRVGYYNNKKINTGDKTPICPNNDLKEEKKENDFKINEKGKNLNEIQKGNKITDSVFITIFVVVLSIVLIIAIGLFYECSSNKGQRKKRINELKDEPELIEKEELSLNKN